jgi:hypothetical protein
MDGMNIFIVRGRMNLILAGQLRYCLVAFGCLKSNLRLKLSRVIASFVFHESAS